MAAAVKTDFKRHIKKLAAVSCNFSEGYLLLKLEAQCKTGI